MPTPTILLGTVLLEAHRWGKDRSPTYRVSEWLDRIAAAGFNGIELWENHATDIDAAELAALKKAREQITIFNSYVTFDDAGKQRRDIVADLIRQFRPQAVKFNVSKHADQLVNELNTARAWAASFPGVKLLCECHAGTALEDPAVAAGVLTKYPDIGVIIHPFMGDTELWFRHLGWRIMHAHVQACATDKARARLENVSALVADNLRIMHTHGYTGSWTIEFTAGVGTAPEDRDALFAAAVSDRNYLAQALAHRATGSAPR